MRKWSIFGAAGKQDDHAAARPPVSAFDWTARFKLHQTGKRGAETDAPASEESTSPP